MPPKVEYRLTRKGKSFVPVIAAIRDWGTRHLACGRQSRNGGGIEHDPEKWIPSKKGRSKKRRGSTGRL